VYGISLLCTTYNWRNIQEKKKISFLQACCAKNMPVEELQNCSNIIITSSFQRVQVAQKVPEMESRQTSFGFALGKLEIIVRSVDKQANGVAFFF
jgi:hypothetical protein